jgi:hypothetical protein
VAEVDVTCRRCGRPARLSIALLRRGGAPLIEELDERCAHCGGA